MKANAQNTDSLPESLNNYNIYSYFLSKHIEYLDRMQVYTTLDYSKELIIYTSFEIAQYLPIELKGRKLIILTSEEKMKMHYKKVGDFAATQIFPIGIENNIITISFRMVIFNGKNYGVGDDGSWFKLEFNCETNRYQLITKSYD